MHARHDDRAAGRSWLYAKAGHGTIELTHLHAHGANPQISEALPCDPGASSLWGAPSALIKQPLSMQPLPGAAQGWSLPLAPPVCPSCYPMMWLVNTMLGQALYLDLDW